jgi:hypothetical protein
MTIVESRLKAGTLTLGGTSGTGGTDFACQVTNCRITPSSDDDGDAQETLSGDVIAAGKKVSYVLAGTAIQDFDSPDGFQSYCHENATQTVEFSWNPSATSPTYSGTCVIVPVEIGGDVNSRLTTDFEFDINGDYTETPPAAGNGAQTAAA